MALNVGELYATLTLDDGKFSSGLKKIPGEAESAGRDAGRKLGDGLDSGSKLDASTLYSSRGDFEAAAGKVGEAGGEGLGDGMDGGTSGLGDMLGGKMSAAGPPMLAAAAAVAAVVGAALIEGVGMAMDKEVAVDKLQAQLGASGPMAKDYGKIAGKLYAEGYGEGYSDITAAIKAASNNGLILEDMSKAEAEAVTRNLMMVSDVLEQDIGMTSEAVGAMLKNGLAKDSQEAFDILTRGVQQGVDKSGDLMETFQEYSPLFAKLGLDASISTGLLSQGLKAGARDADFVADALKEFQIIGASGSTAAAEGFALLGINAKEATAMIAAGGPDATYALDDVLRKLRETEDPVKRNAAAVALFGTKAEDLGDSLYALDPSTAAAGLGEVAGATDGLGSAYDNAKTKIEGFKRQGMEKLTTFIGETVIPAVERFAQSKGFQEWLADVQRVATDVVDWFVRNWPTISATIETMAGHAMAVLDLLWQHTQVGIDVFMWLWNNVLSPLAAWVDGTMLPAFARIGQWIMTNVVPPAMALGSAFITVMGWIGNAVNSIVGFVTGIPGRIGGVVSTMWNGISNGIAWARDAVSGRVGEIVDAVTGIPGRIGDMGNRLYNGGKDLIQGLINGVTDMAGKAVDKIKNVAGDMVDGALGVLGIRSPSRVFMEIGQHTVEGLALGIERERLSALSSLSGVVGSLAPAAMAQLGGLASPTGSLSTASAGGSTSVRHGDVNVQARTDADPHQIGKAVAWELKTAGV